MFPLSRARSSGRYPASLETPRQSRDKLRRRELRVVRESRGSRRGRRNGSECPHSAPPPMKRHKYKSINPKHEIRNCPADTPHCVRVPGFETMTKIQMTKIQNKNKKLLSLAETAELAEVKKIKNFLCGRSLSRWDNGNRSRNF